MKTLKIALKNVSKHKGKNILVGIMIFLSVFIFLFTAAIVEKSIHSWRDFFGTTTMGYVNIGAREGMKKDFISPPVELPKKYISEDIIKYLDSTNTTYTKRIRAGGIKYNFEEQKFDGGHNAVNILGTDFEKESLNLTNLKIIEGRYDKELENGALVWKKLMTKYKWQTGDEISFFMQDKNNSMMPYSFIITGVVENIAGNNMESVEEQITINPVIFVKYNYIARMLDIEGLYTELAIWEKNKEKIEALRSKSKIGGNSFYYADEAYGVIQGITGFIKFLGYFIGIFIMIISGIAMFNINIMGFMERQKEIGSMLAMGAKPRWVMKLITFEMGVFGVAALILSVGLYAMLGIIFSNGVNFGELGILFSGQNFQFIVVGKALVTTVAVISFSMFLSTIYPLLLTNKLNPVEIFKEGEM